MTASPTCTLKTEQPPSEVIQERRIACEDAAEHARRRSAAQRQPANTRSESVGNGPVVGEQNEKRNVLPSF